MPTFTTVTNNVVTLGFSAYDIDVVARGVMESMLASAPRGAKCKRSYSPLYRDGLMYLCTTIEMRNMRGTLLDTALVYGEQPETAGQRTHAFGGLPIKCRECENDKFYDLGRSLDYNNHVCSQCGAAARTITETGASA